jgi:UDP-N-acetylmuramoylalanine--D-glutamate ligase
MNAAIRKTPSTQRPGTLVYGLGSTGLSVARFLNRTGVDATFIDSRDCPPGLDELRRIAPDADVVVGDVSSNLLQGVTRIIVSPGIADNDEFLLEAREADIEIVSDIELFSQTARTDFVAITGSNGKSTVTTLIALMCDAGGMRALAGANLGRPALDLLVDETPDLFVLELSSFQLQRTKHLPAKVAVLLNVSADHLDWHSDEAEYRRAKFRIFDQADAAVVNREDPDARQTLPDDMPCITFGLDAPDAGHYGVIVEDDIEYLARGDTALFACHDIALVGLHNRANVLAAMAAGELIGLEPAAMLQVVAEFPGLPHRMQFVRNVNDANYINDSKATNVAAAIASVMSLDGPVVLIAGGQGKGGDFAALAAAVAGKLRAVVVFGEDAGLLADAFKGKAELHLVSNLGEAVGQSAVIAAPGDTVLLAPACASFDQFDNYMRRGDAFCTAVEGLGK